jgi:hypothetical protein
MESSTDIEELTKFQPDAAKEKVETFVNCLCKIYIGHSIHQRINNEISKQTNLFILKGDYFISLGYSTVTTLGNPLIVRFYSKIAENFAKVFKIFVNIFTPLIRACSIWEDRTKIHIRNLISLTSITSLKNILD